MEVLIFLFKLNLKVVYFFLKMLKTNDNKVLFLSRQDDKKSIDFELMEKDIKMRYPNVKLVILIKTLSKKNAFFYYFHIYHQMYHLATSKVCLTDTYIIPISILKHKKSLKIIQLCHGIGNVKKFGYQVIKKGSNKNKKLRTLMNMHANYDYLISTSKETSKFYSEAFNIPMDRIMPIGNPKIDYILKIGNRKKDILNNYPQLKDKPVVLYVSTFRKYNSNYLKKFVDGALFDDFNIIVNIHPVAYKYHPDIDKFLTDDRILRCPEYNTQELLSVADIVITDYSSFMFESAILEIPTYLFVPDYDKYVSVNGLNIDLFSELPNYVYKNSNNLWAAIKKGDYDYKVLRRFKKKYVYNCNGKATRTLVDFIVKIMNEH